MKLVNYLIKLFKKIQFRFILKPKKHIYRKLTFYSLNKNKSFLRLSSYPLASGDTFRKFSDHIFDETKKLNPKKVKDDDIVFLSTDLKDIFFEQFHNQINAKYFLITHNSDLPIELSDLNYIDEKIKHWFAMKLNVEMNKNISPLPAGFENLRYLSNGIVSNFIKTYKLSSNLKKSNNILCSFKEGTNKGERVPLLKIAKTHNLIDVKNFTDNKEYLRCLSQYKFNLCPDGNYFESHRLWETLFFGGIPILKKNTVNLNFINIGIPAVLLEDWGELNNPDITTYLDKKILNKSNDPRKYVFFDFWKDRINSKKSEFHVQ